MVVNKFFHSLLYLGIILSLNSCAYKFSNSNVRTIGAVKTIAVEGIFDTSKTAVGHEALWEQLQRAIARDGHIRIVSRETADALLRVQIKDAKITPSGGAKPVSGPTKDPKRSYNEEIDPDRLRNLSSAGFFTENELITASFEADLIDLRNGGILFQKVYTGSGQFKSIRNERYFARNSGFLFYQEASRSTFRRISESVASQILNDLLIRW